MLSSKKKTNFFSFIICLTEKNQKQRYRESSRILLKKKRRFGKGRDLEHIKATNIIKKIDFRADNDVEDSDWWRNQRIFDPLTKCWRAFLEIV